MTITPAFAETLKKLRGGAFQTKLKQKNIDPATVANVKELLALDDSQLLKRAQLLYEKAVESLKFFYSDSGDILIPFSGGRDSTLLAAITVYSFPNRKCVLLTATTGLALNDTGRNSSVQAKRLLKKSLCNNAQHFFVDLSSFFSKYVVSQAKANKQILGYPAICTCCKMVMEIAFANIAIENGYKHVPFGYAQYQSRQHWTEQTAAFRDTMQCFHNRYHSQLNIGSPLKYVLQSPIDTSLVLGFLNFRWEEQKNEGKCVAGGMNPVSIDELQLTSFMQKYLASRIDCNNLVFSTQSNALNKFDSDIKALKSDMFYMQRVYNNLGIIKPR